MDRVIWILIVIFAAMLASLLGSFLAWLFKPLEKPGTRRRRTREEEDTTRNAPKGTAAVVFWVLAGLGCGGLTCLAGMSLVIILVQNIPETKPDDNANRDKPPENQKPQVVGEDLGAKERQTLILGGHADVPFREEARLGEYLIGFDIGVGPAFGVDLVKSIQPHFHTPQGEKPGRKLGTDWGTTHTVKAKPGYAVGAITVKNGLVVNGLSVTFMRVKGDKLDPKDTYTSPWIGDRTGGGPPTLLSHNGALIVGVIGMRTAEDVTGLGLLKR